MSSAATASGPALGLPLAPAGRGRGVVRSVLIGITAVFLTLFIVLPVANVFTQALSKGIAGYTEVFSAPAQDPAAKPSLVEKRRVTNQRAKTEKTWSAIRLSFGIVLVVVPLNIVFGLVAAWTVTKFRFRGRALLVALIDLPFSVSPVVAGLAFVLLFGRVGVLGAWASNFTWPDPSSIAWQGLGAGWPLAFSRYQTGIIFTPLAIAMASVFVTFPFVARSLIPLMQSQGSDEELAALSLGAGGWRTFRTVTLPNIRWALLYGVILCTARAFGEFGAVSVVSGNTDANDTMPLRIEKLWQEYDNQAAFTVASLLALLAVVTLVVKTAVDVRAAGRRAAETGATAR